MSTAPMRSAIRVLSNSPVVERIARRPETNKIQIVCNEGSGNTRSVEDVVKMLNFYFGKAFNAPDALEFVQTDGEPKTGGKNCYYISSYNCLGTRLLRAEIASDFARKTHPGAVSELLAEIELVCLESAKEFLSLQKTSGRKSNRAVIELDYTNIRDLLLFKEYESRLRALPAAIAAQLDVSLARIRPASRTEDINALLHHVSAIRPAPGISVDYDENLHFVEDMLKTQAKTLYVTMDVHKVGNIGDVLQTQNYIKERAGDKRVFFVLKNLDAHNRTRYQKDADAFLFLGRHRVDKTNPT